MTVEYPVDSHVSDLLFEALAPRMGVWLTGGATGFDGDIRALMQHVGHELAQRVVDALSESLIADARSAGFTIERSQDITFHSLYGQLHAPSPTMIHPDETRQRPVSLGLSVQGGGKTLLLQRALCDFGIDDSFAQARAKVKEHYGIDIGRDSIRRTVEHNGQTAIDFLHQHLHDEQTRVPPQTEPVDVMLVELDGSEARTGHLVPIEGSTALTPVRKLRVRMRKTQWRDVRVGLVRPLEETTKSYVASLSSLDTTANNLRALANLRGAHKETQFVKVIDGGPGIREAVDGAMAGPVILDRPHFHHQLYETVDAMGVSATQRTGTVMRWSRTAANGHVRALIGYLSAWRPAEWTRADEERLAAPRETVKLPHEGLDRVRRLIGHLKRFEDAVAYDAFREKGWPVGSGEVESAHRILPQPRLKKPGTWWLPENIDRILALRVIRQNGWWDDFWSSRCSSGRAVA